jgi:hypothetical protein
MKTKIITMLAAVLAVMPFNALAELKEEMLQQVVDGKSDVKNAREDAEKSQKEEEMLAAKFEALDAAIDTKDWKKAGELVDEIAKAKPEMANSIRYGLAVMKKDSVEAAKQAKIMADGEIKDDSEGLNAMAWGLATEFENPGKELLETAAYIVKKAVELSKGEPAVLDTLARIQFLQGLKDEAVKTLEKAIAKTEDEDLKGQFKISLESMKKGELPKIQQEEMESGGE